jgi:basic membrane protein A
MVLKLSDKDKKVDRRKFLSGIVATAVVAAGAGAAAGYLGAGTPQAPSPTTQTVTQSMTGAVGAVGRPLNIAIAIPGKSNDLGWNQAGVEGAQAAKALFGANLSVSENTGYGDTVTTALQDYVNKNMDLIIAHASGYLTNIATVAPSAPATVHWAFAEGADPQSEIVPGQQSPIGGIGQEAAYLAGVLAAGMSKTGIIGEVVSLEPPNWNRMSAGFMLGINATNPKAKFIYSIVGSYEDPTKANETTLPQISQGADVIFGQGDGTSFGIMQACTDKKVWFIDVIGNKRSIDTAGILLTSVLWDFSVPFNQMVADIYNGSFGKYYTMTVANGGVKLLDPLPGVVPADVWSKVQDAQKAIASGTLQVPEVNTSQDLAALRQKLFGS